MSSLFSFSGVFRTLRTLAIASLLFIAGVLFGSDNPKMTALKKRLTHHFHLTETAAAQPPANHPIQGDAYSRLIRYPNKQEVACPAQTDKTVVLLISGQSNSANHGGQRYISEHGARVLNYFAGKCYIAASPLLGASGLEGDSWTLLGNKLIQSGRADTVIINPTGIGGSWVKQWQVGSDFHTALLHDYHQLSQTYRPTHFLWHQGESDFIGQTSTEEYSRLLSGTFNSLRSAGMTAPIYVSLTSQCWQNPNWHPNNPIRQAQIEVSQKVANAHLGVDTDTLLNEQDRFDNCHFSGTGQEKFAQAWSNLLP